MAGRPGASVGEALGALQQPEVAAQPVVPGGLLHGDVVAAERRFPPSPTFLTTAHTEWAPGVAGSRTSNPPSPSERGRAGDDLADRGAVEEDPDGDRVGGVGVLGPPGEVDGLRFVAVGHVEVALGVVRSAVAHGEQLEAAARISSMMRGRAAMVWSRSPPPSCIRMMLPCRRPSREWPRWRRPPASRSRWSRRSTRSR